MKAIISDIYNMLQQLQMNDDAQSGIHFMVSRGSSKRGKKDQVDRNSMGSTNSMASLQQQTPITRANSVTSMLKRLFSKEDQRNPTQIPTQTDGSGNSILIILPLIRKTYIINQDSIQNLLRYIVIAISILFMIGRK